MTIIAGFKTMDGIVICADTQETIGNLSKRNVPKLRFEPTRHGFYGGPSHQGDEIAAAFCGAAQNGPFIDKLVDNAWQSAQACTSLDEACEKIESSIKKTYKEFASIYQPGYCPEAELIYGVKMSAHTKLFSALGPIVTEQREYATGGAGYYIADFLASRMYAHALTLQQCVILAAYTLFQAKEHVEGCGGDSHIAVLRDSGVSGRVATDRVSAITEALSSLDDEISGLLLHAANLEEDDERFQKKMAGTMKVVTSLRGVSKGQLKSARETMIAVGRILSGNQAYEPSPVDEFGLPKPSESQKSELER